MPADKSCAVLALLNIARDKRNAASEFSDEMHNLIAEANGLRALADLRNSEADEFERAAAVLKSAKEDNDARS